MNTKQLQSKRPLPEYFDKEEVFFNRSSKKVKGSASSKNGNLESSPSQYSKDKNVPKENTSAKKPVFPLIIRKYLNSKGKMKIEDAISQLETPQEKFHRKKLRQMRFLGVAQEQEIQEEISLRKKYNLVETSQHSNQTSTVDEFSTAILSPEGDEAFDVNWNDENWNLNDEFQTAGMESRENDVEKAQYSENIGTTDQYFLNSEQATWEDEQSKGHSIPNHSGFEKEMDAPIENQMQQEFDTFDYSFTQFAPQQQEDLSMNNIPVEQQSAPIVQEQENLIQFELSKSQSLANDQLQQISYLLQSKNQVSMMRPFYDNQVGFLPIASSFERQRYQNGLNSGSNGHFTYGNNPFNGNNFSSINFQNGNWEVYNPYQFQPIA